MIYLHLIYLPLKFTSILFQKIRRCAPHIETCQRPPTLTLGSTFHIQYRHIPTTASRLFHSQQPLQAVLLHRLNLSFPAPSHTDTSQPNSRPPQPSTPKKKPEGCAEGPWLYGPFAVFLFSPKTPKNIFLPTFPSKVCRKINKILVVFTIKKVYHIKINYKQTRRALWNKS